VARWVSWAGQQQELQVSGERNEMPPGRMADWGPAIDNGKPQGSSSAWMGFGEGQAALGLVAKDPPVLLTFVQMFGALQSMNVCLRYLCTK
jgi:hypothetical protein